MPKQPMTKDNGNLDTSLIKFSAKELFFEINRKIDLLATKTETKADTPRVDVLANVVSDLQRKGSDVSQHAVRRCDSLENRMANLEKESASQSAVADNNLRIDEQVAVSKRQWWAITVTILVGLSGLIVGILQLVKHG